MNTTPSSSPSYDSNSPFVDLPFGEDEGIPQVAHTQNPVYSTIQGSNGPPQKTKPRPVGQPSLQQTISGKVVPRAVDQSGAQADKYMDVASERVPPASSWLRRSFSRDAIAFLTSLIFHTLILIFLMAFIVAIDKTGISTSLIMSTAPDSEGDDSSVDISMDTSSRSDDLSAFDNQQPMAPAVSSNQISVATLPTVNGTGEVKLETDAPPTMSGTVSLDSLASEAGGALFVPAGDEFGGFSVEGRGFGRRRDLAMANGGSAETEAAVEAAIVWLVKHQFKDGSWSTLQDHPDCMDACRDGSVESGQLGLRQPKAVAATGLALLVMLGAGYTHREGPYRDEVYRALQFLLNAMQTGDPAPEDPRSPGQFTINNRHMMYEQGIATFALCEAYHMTKDKWLERGAQLAINFVRSAQAKNGSWDYFPGQANGDLSIAGWQMMALRSAAAAGLVVPAANVRRIDNFLNSRTVDRGETYFYRKAQVGVPELTAIAALMRLMRGWSPSDPKIQRNIQFVFYRNPDNDADDGPEMTDVYFNYYATNLLFYSHSNLWPMWNERLKTIYLATQSKEGHEAGSWFAHNERLPGAGFSSLESDNGLNRIGGRLYTTTMAALTLEVYYRILPIQHDDVKIDFKL